jgi:hypothetical protein
VVDRSRNVGRNPRRTRRGKIVGKSAGDWLLEGWCSEKVTETLRYLVVVGTFVETSRGKLLEFPGNL